MRLALGIEYNGAAYCGWQRQNHSKSVQEQLELALSKVANHPVTVFCAGRTDTGVSATGQVVHFDTDSIRKEKAWYFGTNHHLPDDVAVVWAKEVDEDFHARFSATARRYRYLILNRNTRSALLHQGVDWCYGDLNVDAMSAACPYFLGEQDFSAVRAASCQSTTPMRCIYHLTVQRFQSYVVIDVEANAFLHHMVRNIVGILKHIGLGLAEPEWAKILLEGRDRTKAPATAAARGLYLVDVRYPDYSLPSSDIGPLFLPNNL